MDKKTINEKRWNNEATTQIITVDSSDDEVSEHEFWELLLLLDPDPDRLKQQRAEILSHIRKMELVLDERIKAHRQEIMVSSICKKLKF